MINTPYKQINRYIGLVIAAILMTTVALLRTAPTSAAGAFVTTWQTDRSQPSNSTLTIPTAQNETYNYFINWGDGNTESGVTGSVTHTYASPGTYQVSISGVFPRIHVNNGPERLKLLSVDAWGSVQWSSMVDAFEGCENMVVNATDAPDLSQVESLSGMFRGATSFNQSINHWDVSHVSSIANIFERASTFNQPLNNWNTSNIIMFSSAFRRASAFNQNISNWNTGSAKSMYAMFAYATSFNQPLNSWNVASVNDIRDMFGGATSFNQPLNNWNTGNVIRTESMFRNAVRFNQDVSMWNYAKVTNAGYMFSGTRLSGQNYDKLLAALEAGSTERNVVLDAGSSTYCVGGEARRKLIQNKGWTVLDQGQDPNSCSSSDVQFETGVGALVDENKPAGTEVGRLKTLHPNPDQSFTYSFCSGNYPDHAFFELKNGVITTKEAFDFENPKDDNKDSVYNLCIVSTDSLGGRLTRVVTVAVADIENEGENQSGGGNDGNSGSGGQTLGTSTDKKDESTLAKVLGVTGIASWQGVAVGSAIVVGTAIISYRKRQQRQHATLNNKKR